MIPFYYKRVELSFIKSVQRGFKDQSVETHAGIRIALDQNPTSGREFVLPFYEAGWGDKSGSNSIWKARSRQPVDVAPIQREAYGSDPTWLSGNSTLPRHRHWTINTRHSRRS